MRQNKKEDEDKIVFGIDIQDKIFVKIFVSISYLVIVDKKE